MKKLCQYCFQPFDRNLHKKTAEHIFPASIIKLYPEQQISFSSQRGAFVDNRGITISDVCQSCNNLNLSELDSYGKSLISEHFFNELPASQCDASFSKQLNYKYLTRWILKILYNSERAKHNDISWFLSAIQFILRGLLVENISFSIFAGIHINTTPLPEKAYNYMPMQINDNPRLFCNSLANSALGITSNNPTLEILGAKSTYCIRLGIAVFYCILWNKEAPTELKQKYDQMLQSKFDFTKLSSVMNEYQLKCISSHSNTTMGYGHLITKAGIQQDREIIQAHIGGRKVEEVQELFNSLRSPKDMEQGQALVEMAMFPDNKAIRKKYEKLTK